jgi:dolichol-phosphate mannosyltransferase
MDRKCVDSVISMREKNRYLPGLRAWVGYKNAIVYYDRHDRLAGDGKLSFISRIKYAMDAITSFSYKPLRLSFALFGLTLCLSVLMALSTLLASSAVTSAALGVSSAVFLVGSMLLLAIGVQGEYVGRVYDEVRNRPLSIISRVHRQQARIATQIPRIANVGGSFAVQPEAYGDSKRTEAA